jgi:hypothetical protein
MFEFANQHQCLPLAGKPPARLTIEQSACGEKVSSPARHLPLPGGAKVEAVIISGKVC